MYISDQRWATNVIVGNFMMGTKMVSSTHEKMT